MRRAVSISELERYAERLPNEASGARHRVAVMSDPGPVPRYDLDRFRYDEVYNTIEFVAKPTVVDGIRCTAWYYHDVLVKVCV